MSNWYDRRIREENGFTGAYATILETGQLAIFYAGKIWVKNCYQWSDAVITIIVSSTIQYTVILSRKIENRRNGKILYTFMVKDAPF